MTDRIRSHGTPTHGRPRFLAILTALSMMTACAIPSLLPKTAEASSITSVRDDIILDGANCKREWIELSSDTGQNTIDDGVATWVVGNMNIGTQSQGSYAVEAEGLTYVQGNLVLNPLKTSWGQPLPTYPIDNEWYSAGFRFGTVGFGAQFRPAAGSTALAVGGDVTAYTHGSFTGGDWYWSSNDHTNLGNLKYKSDTEYTAKLHSSANNVQNPATGSAGRPSVVGDPRDWSNDKNLVTWNASSNDLETVNDQSMTAYGDSFKERSKKYALLPSTGTNNFSSTNVSAGGLNNINDNTRYLREKYTGTGSNKLNYTFEYSNSHKEKLLTFNGTGTSDVEVFNIDASVFDGAGDNGTYSGISYSFTNIKDGASVIINVNGTPNAFHNGWRFWWNGTEIANQYTAAIYSKAASSIMWNFKNASNVTILGGTYNSRNPGDDPAAAMLGSIMVPNGNLESHVTTNGRVWVGNNYSMINAKRVGGSSGDYSNSLFWDGDSASVLDMDQERHNLPFNYPCSTVGWEKVDDDETTRLAGTTWAVYGTKADAISGRNALRIVTDNSDADQDKTDGVFMIYDVEYAANYYIRELETVDGYQRNTNIYQIQTVNADGLMNAAVHNLNNGVAAVYDASGTAITDNQLMNSTGQIVNRRKTEAKWEKYSTEDTSFEDPLPGSAWRLDGGELCGEGCKIIDGAKEAATGITVNRVTGYNTTTLVTANANITVEYGESFELLASISPAGATQIIEWSSDQPAVVSVEDITSTGERFKLTANDYSSGYVTITGKASRFPDVTFTFSVKVNTPVDLTTVYVNTNAEWNDGGAIGGGTVYLHYKFVGESTYQTPIKMESVCGSYLRARFDANNKNVDGIYFSDSNTNPNRWLNPNKSPGQHFTVSHGAILRVENASSQSSTAPSCAAAKANALMRRAASDDSSSSNADPNANLKMLSDEDDVAGKIKITGLEIGVTYTLTEIQAPEGYYLNPNVYSLRINQQGQAEWSVDALSDLDEENRVLRIQDKPTSFEWDKVDGGYSDENTGVTLNDKSLPNTVWELSRYTLGTDSDDESNWSVIDTVTDCVADASTGCSGRDIDPEGGAFRIEKLSVGIYRLTEQNPPEGYEGNVVRYFKVKYDPGDNGVLWSESMPEWDEDIAGLSVGGSVNTAYNYRQTGTLNWTKVSSDDPATPISGSEWTLTFESYDKNGETPLLTAECEIRNGQVSCGADYSWAKNDGYDGNFILTGLPWGTYVLTETKAPAGFYKDHPRGSIKIMNHVRS
ncbi:MAG: SpaA isopeptide-forming pilin-related protein [Bifidobacteriaceae bacterium]|nr:SpaA isopeptide-forming pilin-related protein [Bifidobacteriaceae bacterium]